MEKMVTLTEAIESGDLESFIRQQEKIGVGPINLMEFDETAAKLIRTERSDDQTSGSPRRDGSREK